MPRYSISDSIDDAAQAVEKPHAIEKKKRYSIEEPSQFKRKAKMAAQSFGQGSVSAGSTVYEFLKPTLKPRGFKETFEDAASLSKSLQEKFNLEPDEAEDMAERYIQAGFRGAGAGAITGLGGAVAGAAGSLAGQSAREVGAPEWMATGADIITSAFTPTKALGKAGSIASKTPEMAKRSSVIASEGLPPVRGILKEPGKLIKPVATPEGMASFEKKIARVIEEKSSKIMEESLLGKQLDSKGTVIGDLINDAYDQTLKLAKANPNKIDLSIASKNIGKAANRIQKSAPSLSESTEAVVKKLRKYENDFANKKMKPEQLTTQWKEINKDLSSLYSKVELTGAEELYRKSLEEVKEVLLKTASRQLKDKPLINSFRQQNKLYSESQKFEKAKSLLDPVFEEGFKPNKFRQVFSSPRKFADLEKSLGKKNAYRLRDIQKYYVQPIEQMKKQYKVKSLIDLDSVVTGFVVKKILGFPVAAAIKLTPFAKGKLLMSEKTQNLWVNLMRSIKDGSQRGVIKYSELLEKELEEGSD